MVVLEEEKFTGLLSGWGLTARSCDNCCSTAALLYCRSHAAFLCGACDSKLHRHVIVARHERVWICEVCEQAPASVTCKADAAALCTSCDRDIHSANPLARRHERVPVVPFFESPSADATLRPSFATSASASAFLFSDPSATVTATATVGAVIESDPDAWLIPNSGFMYNNDSDLFDFSHGSNNQQKIQIQIQNNNNNNNEGFENYGCFAFADSVVPSQSNCFDIDFSQPDKTRNQIISSSFNFPAAQPSVSSSDIGVVPEGNTNSTSEASYTFTKSASNAAAAGDGVTSSIAGATPAPVLDREARVLRYREKRKNRKFQKTIRYASRKAYAESRPRIKGRFAKRTETSDTSESDPIYGIGSGGFAVDRGGYGVVPSF